MIGHLHHKLLGSQPSHAKHFLSLSASFKIPFLLQAICASVHLTHFSKISKAAVGILHGRNMFAGEASLQRVQEPVALQHGDCRSAAGGHHVCVAGGCVVQVCQHCKRISAPACILCSLHSQVSAVLLDLLA